MGRRRGARIRRLGGAFVAAYCRSAAVSQVGIMLLLLLIYIMVNLLFAGLYYLIGINHLAGVNTGSPWKNFTAILTLTLAALVVHQNSLILLL